MSGDPMRVDPLGADFDLSDFEPVTKRPTLERQIIREVSEAVGFPSWAPGQGKSIAQRRRRTGRNVQLNIKMTAETATRFAALADRRDVAFGELLKQLLDEASA